MPSTSMQATGAALSSGGYMAMNGMLTRKVRQWAVRMALMRSLSVAPSRLM